VVFSYHTYSYYNNPADNNGNAIGYIDPNSIYNVNPHGGIPTCEGIGPPPGIMPTSGPPQAVVVVGARVARTTC